MSTKNEGLQNCLDKFANYCSKWGLSMNYKKTKIMIFNKGCKLIKCSFSVNDYKLECVKEYKYLGLLIGCGGNFSIAISDLVRNRPFNLKGGGLWFFISFRIFFSDSTRVRIKASLCDRKLLI
jgi:hypothetical protein